MPRGPLSDDVSAQGVVPPGVEGSSPTAPVVAPLSPPRRNRLLVFLGIGAAIVVVLLLVVLVLPSLGSSSDSGGPQTYSQARPVADQSVSGYGSGGWAALAAIGLDSASAYTAPLNFSGSGTSNCTVTPAPGLSANVTVPAYTGSRGAGVAPFWEFLYRNGAGAVSVVLVDDGKGTVVATISGTCQTIFGLFLSIPAGVIDSDAAAAAVAPYAGAFLAANPNATAEFAIIGGFSFLGTVGAEWSVKYSTCTLGKSAAGTGTAFNATVNATTGNVRFYQTLTGVTCSSSSSVALASSDALNGQPSAVTRASSFS